ncbi:MAG: PAS domain S-box protein [bacterium]
MGEKKQKESRSRCMDEVKSSEGHYRELVEGIREVIFECDTKGRLTYLNRAWVETLGYKIKESLGQYVVDFIFEDDKRKGVSLLARGGNGTNARESGELRFLNIRGDIVWLILCVRKNKKKGYIGSLYNITERKTAEEERIRLATAIEQTAECVIITDLEGTIQYVNPAFENITGYSREEVNGQNTDILRTNRNETFYREMWETIVSNAVWKGRVINKKKNNSTYEAEMTISPVRDSSGKLVNFVFISRDITHEAELENQLRLSQKMQAIGTLAGGIAHDFNNILTAILGFSDLALDGTPKKSDSYTSLKQIIKAGNRAVDLIRQILTFSRRTDEGQRPVMLQPIIKETLKLLRASLPPSIEIHHDLDNQCGPVLAETTQIHQIVMNLCTNAYHAMLDHGGLLEVCLKEVDFPSECATKSHELRLGKYARLSVKDTGHGIDKVTLDRIFEPYFTTKVVGKGTGLGLATVHGIVQSHDGAINVDSEPGKGSTFNVYLPLCDREIEVNAEEELDKNILEGYESILFVDDEEPIRHLIEISLGRLGYDIESCPSSIEALETFRAEPTRFDLLITDQMMPKMMGVELVKEVRKIRSDIPIILCTGFEEIINELQCKDLGIQEYVTKPIIINNLVYTLRRLLDEKLT